MNACDFPKSPRASPTPEIKPSIAEKDFDDQRTCQVQSTLLADRSHGFFGSPVQHTKSLNISPHLVINSTNLQTLHDDFSGTSPDLVPGFNASLFPPEPLIQPNMLFSNCPTIGPNFHLNRNFPRSILAHQYLCAEQPHVAPAQWFGKPQTRYTRFVFAYKISLFVHL